MSKNFKTRKADKDRFIIENMTESHIEAFMKKKVAEIEKELGVNPRSKDDYAYLQLEFGIWPDMQTSIGYSIGELRGVTYAFIPRSIDKQLESAKKQIEFEQMKRMNSF